MYISVAGLPPRTDSPSPSLDADDTDRDDGDGRSADFDRERLPTAVDDGRIEPPGTGHFMMPGSVSRRLGSRIAVDGLDVEDVGIAEDDAREFSVPPAPGFATLPRAVAAGRFVVDDV